MGTELFDWFMAQEHKINGYNDSYGRCHDFLSLRMIEFSIENNTNEILTFQALLAFRNMNYFVLSSLNFKKNIMIKKLKVLKQIRY